MALERELSHSSKRNKKSCCGSAEMEDTLALFLVVNSFGFRNDYGISSVASNRDNFTFGIAVAEVHH